jgi:Na+/proline symporter
VSASAIVSPFALLDAAIAAASLAVTLWIGVRVKRYVGTIESYLVASRGMGLYVGAASLLSTEVGIITYMYEAQFGFVAGFSAFAVGLITFAVCLAVGRTGFVITRLREMRILTVPEYFEKRYGRGVRVLAGVLMALGGSLNLGIFPIIEARFLAIVTGIPPRFLGWTMAALLLVALAYTAIGGMVSLIVTNYVQYVFLAAGTVVVTLVCLREVGWGSMVRAVDGHMGGHGFDPVADLGVGFILWQVLLWVALMTVWQSVAMRTFSTKDPAVGKKMFTLTGFLFLGRALIPMVWGIAALAFFWGRAEPVATAGSTPSARIEHLASSGPRFGAARAGAAAGGPPRAARPRGGPPLPGSGPARGRGARPPGRDRPRGDAVDARGHAPDGPPGPRRRRHARGLDLDVRRVLPELGLDHRPGCGGSDPFRRDARQPGPEERIGTRWPSTL